MTHNARASLGVLLIAGTTAVTWLWMASAEDEPPARQSPLEWGLLTMRTHTDFKGHLKKNFARFASKPDYIMFFYAVDFDFPLPWVEAPAELGAATMVSLELWKWGKGKSQPSLLPAIIAGEYDDSLRRWAISAKRFGQRILLRFGYEFNGDWFTWSLDPTRFVAAWRRAHDVFTDVGADNVEWVWAPNFESCPNTPENNMHLYYPGDNYVDWVAVDGYNFGDHHDQWHHWQSFEEVFDKVLDAFEQRYPTKPVFISEFGCAPGAPGRQAQWIRDAHAALQHRPQVKAVLWFDLDKRREHEPNFKIDAEPESLRAFNETFARQQE